MAQTVDIVDFAADDKIIEFYVGLENHFVAAPDIPLGLMQQITKFRDIRTQLEKDGADLEPMLAIFDELLDERSATLFRNRVADKTIGIVRITKILPWLMEQYGLRPTQPSQPSLDGSSDGETGSSSTDGASLTVSETSLDSAPATPSV